MGSDRHTARARAVLVAGLGAAIALSAAWQADIASSNEPLIQPPPGRSGSTASVRQQLIARASGGGVPNAAVLEPTISGDARIGRYVAYSSRATSIAPGADGHSNVFLVKRGGSPGALGTPWKYGSTKLVSRGRGGAAADGDSYSPSLGGWTMGDRAKRARCLGFVSQASNLVAGDANGRADAFVRRLVSGKLQRIRAPAAVSEMAVSGDCRTFAVVAGGSLYVKRDGEKLRERAGGGGVRSPSLTFNGAQVAYAQYGKVRVRGTAGGGARRIATGSNPTGDVDPPKGRFRRLAYERGGATYIKAVGGGEKRMSTGSSSPVVSAGGGQAMFAFGPYVYIYAVGNSFGLKLPKGYCPLGQGVVNGLDLSARGNYAVLACTGGAAYLSYIGPK